MFIPLSFPIMTINKITIIENILTIQTDIIHYLYQRQFLLIF